MTERVLHLLVVVLCFAQATLWYAPEISDQLRYLPAHFLLFLNGGISAALLCMGDNK